MAIVGAAMQIAFWTIVLPTAIMILINLVGELFYGIGMLLFEVMDLLQSTFRKLAGLGTVYMDNANTSSVIGGSTANKSGDIVSLVLTSNVVIDVLISVSVFALGLVIVGSIVQMVRLEYTTEGSKNSKEKIFTNALKSLLMFVLIPIVSLVGIRISNYLLQAVDYATSGSGASTVSGSVFRAACGNANKAADEKLVMKGASLNDLLGSLFAPSDYNNAVVTAENGGGKVYIKHFQNTFFVSGNDDTPQVRARLAQKVDEAFTTAKEDADGIFKVGGTPNENDKYWDGTKIEKGDKLSYFSIDTVSYFYNISRINYLVLYLGCYLCIKALFNASLGMITRIYKITALFIIAPATIGLQPIDDGAAFKKWKSSFIQNVLSCYGIIVALNLYFVIVGILQRINLWDGWFMRVPNLFVQFLFVITGATMLKSLAGDIGGFIGGGNAMADGEAAAGDIGKIASSVTKVAGMGAMAAGGIANKIGAKINMNKGIDTGETDANGKAIKTSVAAEQQKIDNFNDRYIEEKDEDGNVIGTYAKGADGKKGAKIDTATDASYIAANDARNEAVKRFKTNEKLSKASAKATTMEFKSGMMGASFGEAFKSSGLMSSIKNITGNAASLADGSMFKESQEAYMAKLKEEGVDVDKHAKGLAGSTWISRATDERKKNQLKAKVATINTASGGSTIAVDNKNAQELNRQALTNAENEARSQQEHFEGVQSGLKSKHSDIDSSSGYNEMTNETYALQDLFGQLKDAIKDGKSKDQLEGMVRSFMSDPTKMGSMTVAGSEGDKIVQNLLSSIVNSGGHKSARENLNNALINIDESTLQTRLKDDNLINDQSKYGSTLERESYNEAKEAAERAEKLADEIRDQGEHLITSSEVTLNGKTTATIESVDLARELKRLTDSQAKSLKEVIERIEKREDVKKVVLGDKKIRVEDTLLKEQLDRLIRAHEEATRKKEASNNDLVDAITKLGKKMK